MQIKEEVKELWKLCFDDSDEFVEMYFRLCYSDETTVYIQSGDKVVSSLQMPCYPMTFEGAEIRAAYISGACTHPRFRGKGIMAHLLAESFGRMVQKGIPLSMLMPADPGLYDYYARAGYARAFFRSPIEQHIPDGMATKSDLHFGYVTAFDPHIFDYFTTKAYARPNYVQHTAADFEAVMEDLCIGQGSVIAAYKGDGGPIAGILFAYPEGDSLVVPEWFADHDGIRDSLFREAARHYLLPKIRWFEWTTGSANEESFGMARIINARRMLGLYAATHPTQKVYICLTDEQLAFNNGYYYIDKGTCTFSPVALKNEHLELDAHGLNAFIFGQIRLYMSLMLE